MTKEKRVINFDDKAKEIIKSRIPEEMDFPKVVLIDNISYCNLKCRMCFHKNMKRKSGIMEWDLYKKIIDEIAENDPNAQIWITFFGEGLMLKDLPERVKYARDKGLTNIILNTNGNLIKTEKSKALIDAGLNGFYVGIDAFKPETYEKIRVGGKLERVVKGVLEYKKLLEEYGKPDQKVVVQFVEMDINADEINDFVKFWHDEHGIQCKIRPMASWAGKVENQASNLVDTPDRLPCYWAMNTINITDKGDIALCSADLDCEVKLGDVVNHSIKEMWNTTVKEFRTNHREGNWDKIPPMCQACKDWQSGYAKYL
jgi:radical SAM protein with 4Fe4S-binding SPASM domain